MLSEHTDILTFIQKIKSLHKFIKTKEGEIRMGEE